MKVALATVALVAQAGCQDPTAPPEVSATLGPNEIGLAVARKGDDHDSALHGEGHFDD